MKEKLSMMLLTLFLFCGTALAQSQVSGTVISAEDNQPIIGASVSYRASALVQ